MHALEILTGHLLLEGAVSTTPARYAMLICHVVGHAAEQRVVAPGLLQQGAGHELVHRPMGDQAGDEALPRDAAPEVPVEPERTVAGAEHLARPDGRRFRGHPRPVAAERVQRVLHDGHRVQLDDPGARPLVGVDVAAELMPELGLPESDVPAPADPAVADVGAAALLDPLGVVADRVVAGEVDLRLRRTQVGVDAPEEMLLHRPSERSAPRRRCRPPVLVCVLVHVERMHVLQREPLVVDAANCERVLRHRPDGEDQREFAALLARRADTADEVVGERRVEGRPLVLDADSEVPVRVVDDAFARDRADARAGIGVTEADERGEVVAEGHEASASSVASDSPGNSAHRRRHTRPPTTRSRRR